jgi:hypothetical protein
MNHMPHLNHESLLVYVFSDAQHYMSAEAFALSLSVRYDNHGLV